MILEFGSATEFIRVTAEYSNAVLVAMLPYCSDFAAKLDLPVPQPITAEHVVRCGVLPWRNKDGGIAGGSITIKGGWTFGFQSGYVGSFTAPHSYFVLQDPDEIPKYFGRVRMTQPEAVEFARRTIRRLAIPLEQVFAETEPQVAPLEMVGTNTVPHYRIEWVDPRGSRSVEIAVNADAKRVELIHLRNRNLERPPPKVKSIPPQSSGSVPYQPPQINPEYARKLIPIVLRAVDEYVGKLGLATPRPLTTNHVARFALNDNGGWPHAEIELTNGWRFIYRNQMVNGYYAPDNLFNSDRRPILIKEFVGDWNLTETQAIVLARETLAKLNYPTNLLHVDFKPEVSKPRMVGKEIIPRFMLRWNCLEPDGHDLVSKVEAEVDASKRELKSLYYDDKAYWNHPPPIDVPISLPPGMNGKPAEGPSRPPGMPIPGGARK